MTSEIQRARALQSDQSITKSDVRVDSGLDIMKLRRGIIAGEGGIRSEK